MSLKFGNRQQSVVARPKIIVFGVGGGGCNAVNYMIEENVEGVDFVIANTDAQALHASPCENKIQLGATITNGLGAGSVPDIGKRAAEESAMEIEDYMRDAHMVFVACGMGGGTGTGAAPVIAKIAKERGLLTIGVVTKPFAFEREKRMKTAEEGILQMRKYCDTTIVISNQNLFRIATERTTLKDAFKMADNVLVSGIRCITDLITYSGMVNLDFADVSVVMSDMECAVMGEGEGEGEDRDIKAVENAMTNPLLEESSIHGATGVLVNISSGHDLSLLEMERIMDRITAEVSPSATIKFGSIFKDDMEGKVRVALVATHSSAMTQKSTAKEQDSKQKEVTNFDEMDAKNTSTVQDKNLNNIVSEPKTDYNAFSAEYEGDNSDAEDEEDARNQRGYMRRKEIDEDEDYFSSFYNEKSSDSASVGSLNEFLNSASTHESQKFVPKKVVNIEEAVNKNRSNTQDGTPKFDFKNIFRFKKA